MRKLLPHFLRSFLSKVTIIVIIWIFSIPGASVKEKTNNNDDFINSNPDREFPTFVEGSDVFDLVCSFAFFKNEKQFESEKNWRTLRFFGGINQVIRSWDLYSVFDLSNNRFFEQFVQSFLHCRRIRL